MNKTVSFISGMIVSSVILLIALLTMMPRMMIVSHQSKFDFETTVQAIEDAIAQSDGWSHKGTSYLHTDIKKSTGNDIGVKIAGVNLCKGNYAETILRDEKARFVSCLMPCTISVWQDNNGAVHISEMNIPLMGKLFGGTISKIMTDKVGPEEKAMLKDIIQ